MAPPLLPITVRAAAMSVVSSLLAQLLIAYQSQTPFTFGWPNVVKFAIYAILTTPLNVLWQDFLEQSFPGSRKEKTGKGEKSTEIKESLHIPNTIVKTLLDQSVGAAVNTLLFCVFIASWDVGVQAKTGGGLPVLLSSYLPAVADSLDSDFVPMMVAGWRFWPLVSIGNFTLVKDISTRNLVGSLAGIVWGVYVNLFAAGPVKEE